MARKDDWVQSIRERLAKEEEDKKRAKSPTVVEPSEEQKQAAELARLKKEQEEMRELSEAEEVVDRFMAGLKPYLDDLLNAGYRIDYNFDWRTTYASERNREKLDIHLGEKIDFKDWEIAALIGDWEMSRLPKNRAHLTIPAKIYKNYYATATRNYRRSETTFEPLYPEWSSTGETVVSESIDRPQLILEIYCPTFDTRRSKKLESSNQRKLQIKITPYKYTEVLSHEPVKIDKSVSEYIYESQVYYERYATLEFESTVTQKESDCVRVTEQATSSRVEGKLLGPDDYSYDRFAYGPEECVEILLEKLTKFVEDFERQQLIAEQDVDVAADNTIVGFLRRFLR